MSFRKITSVFLLAIGLAIVGFAYVEASPIPEIAIEDYYEFNQKSGGQGFATGFSDSYKQMCANRRFLQNAYVGGGGLVMFAAGIFGLMIADRRTA